MTERAANILERFLRWPRARAIRTIRIAEIVLASAVFVLLATVLVGFDAFFTVGGDVAVLEVGDVVEANVRAPYSLTYESEVLTSQRREAAANSARSVYDPPDPDVARRQDQLGRQLLTAIDGIRSDTSISDAERADQFNLTISYEFSAEQVNSILGLSDSEWRIVDEQVRSVLERVMREEIREDEVSTVIQQLPTQVSLRLNDEEALVTVAILRNLIRANTFLNQEATDLARAAAQAAVLPESRSYASGQIIVREGTRVDLADYEALNQFGLLKPVDRRQQEMVRALLSSVLVLVVTGLYIARFKPSLYNEPRMLLLFAALFLVMLFGARLTNMPQQIYTYPSAALAILMVSLAGVEIAVIAAFSLAMLLAMMAGGSMEVAMQASIGGIVGALVLRRAERLNSHFVAGGIVALVNMVVATIFNVGIQSSSISTSLSSIIVYCLFNGTLSAAAALAGMYLVTFLFNLPTSLKLVELSQPGQPLLQRLLREAPGTYQHSLQVANLSEQAANEIGANASLVRVAALYHDIGKMLNPAFFVENQADGVNPHDALNDPYRSVDIIISHVTEGEKMARQYRLPSRIRDFIKEHHGTTQVFYFYRQAVRQAGENTVVDIERFSYPGPAPRTRETAIMMLADSCESTVRARRPTNKQEISSIIQQIISDRMRDGQLNQSGLTLNDLTAIQSIFVEMLQAVFHPRINYPDAVPQPARKPELSLETAATPDELATSEWEAVMMRVRAERAARSAEPTVRQRAIESASADDSEDVPLQDVPPLPRTTGEHFIVKLDLPTTTNGKDEPQSENQQVDS